MTPMQAGLMSPAVAQSHAGDLAVIREALRELGHIGDALEDGRVHIQAVLALQHLTRLEARLAELA